MGLRVPFRIAGHFFARRHARHMGRRGRSVRPVGRPPGPGKSGRLRGGPAVRTFGERGGVGKRASLMGGARRNAACRGRTLPGLRASKGAEARPVGAGRGACGPGPAFLGKGGLKLIVSPDLCASCASSLPRLPPPCACVYSSPSRRTPVSAAARTPRTGYCGRRRRSDRPFRTGFSRWLGRKRRLSPKPPSFKNSLNPFFQL